MDEFVDLWVKTKHIGGNMLSLLVIPAVNLSQVDRVGFLKNEIETCFPNAKDAQKTAQEIEVATRDVDKSINVKTAHMTSLEKTIEKSKVLSDSTNLPDKHVHPHEVLRCAKNENQRFHEQMQRGLVILAEGKLLAAQALLEQLKLSRKKLILDILHRSGIEVNALKGNSSPLKDRNVVEQTAAAAG